MLRVIDKIKEIEEKIGLSILVFKLFNKCSMVYWLIIWEEKVRYLFYII